MSTKDNDIAYFYSRHYYESDASNFFAKLNFPPQTKLSYSEADFALQADW